MSPASITEQGMLNCYTCYSTLLHMLKYTVTLVTHVAVHCCTFYSTLVILNYYTCYSVLVAHVAMVTVHCYTCCTCYSTL